MGVLAPIAQSCVWQIGNSFSLRVGAISFFRFFLSPNQELNVSFLTSVALFWVHQSVFPVKTETKPHIF